MIWLLPNGETFTVFKDISFVPEKYRDKLIEVYSLPEGVGILRRSEDGSFYYEPFPEEPDTPEVPDTPEEPTPEPGPSADDQLKMIMEKLETQEFYNLTLMEMNMALYDEILNLQERLNNA